MPISYQLLALYLILRDAWRAAGPRIQTIGKAVIFTAFGLTILAIMLAGVASDAEVAVNVLPTTDLAFSKWPTNSKWQAGLFAMDLMGVFFVFGGVFARNVFLREPTWVGLARGMAVASPKMVLQLAEKPMRSSVNLGLLLFSAFNAVPLVVVMTAWRIGVWCALALIMIVWVSGSVFVLTIVIAKTGFSAAFEWIAQSPSRVRGRMEQVLRDNPAVLAAQERKKIIGVMRGAGGGTIKSKKNDSSPKPRRL